MNPEPGVSPGGDTLDAGSSSVDGGSPPRGRGRVTGIALVVAALLILVVAAVVVASSQPTDHRFVIPAGTEQRLDNGDLDAVIPSQLHFRAGDTMTVVNEDDARHDIGVTSVGPGETVTYEFPSPGRFDGACTVHPRGSITIDVT